MFIEIGIREELIQRNRHVVLDQIARFIPHVAINPNYICGQSISLMKGVTLSIQ